MLPLSAGICCLEPLSRDGPPETSLFHDSLAINVVIFESYLGSDVVVGMTYLSFFFFFYKTQLFSRLSVSWLLQIF